MHGIPTYPIDGSNTWGGSSSYASSSSSSSDPFESFDIHHASPREKREKFSQLVRRELDSKDVNWRCDPGYKPQTIEMVKEPFCEFVEVTETNNVVRIGFGSLIMGCFSTIIIDEIGKKNLELIQASTLNVKEDLMHSVVASGSMASSCRIIGLAVGTIGLTTVTTAFAYSHFGDRLGRDILNAFNLISNHQRARPSAQYLLNVVRDIFRRKEESWFGKIFERQHPIVIAFLLFTRAFALDSMGAYAEAQFDYQAALGLMSGSHHNTENMIRFAYSRSLRLSGQLTDTIQGQIDRIQTDSPFHKLATIEKTIVMNHPNEIVAEDQIPHYFICPITQNVMATPVFHEFEGFKCYFEGLAIQTWRRNHRTCPCCLKSVEAWYVDKRLQGIIQLWNTTRLIR